MKAWVLVSALVGCAIAPKSTIKTTDPIPKPKAAPAPPRTDSAMVSWYPGRTLRCSLESGTVIPKRLPGVAHRTLPKGTLIRFTHKSKSIIAVVNDRGPMAPGLTYDISRRVADTLRITRQGVAKVATQIVGRIR
jgi:rare lipoprotein A